jgi:hypothetical protein
MRIERVNPIDAPPTLKVAFFWVYGLVRRRGTSSLDRKRLANPLERVNVMAKAPKVKDFFRVAIKAI